LSVISRRLENAGNRPLYLPDRIEDLFRRREPGYLKAGRVVDANSDKPEIAGEEIRQIYRSLCDRY